MVFVSVKEQFPKTTMCWKLNMAKFCLRETRRTELYKSQICGVDLCLSNGEKTELMVWIFSIFDKRSFSSLYVNSDFDNYKRKTDPCTIFTTFHTENALKTRGRHENGMFNKEYLLRFVFRLWSQYNG